MTRPPLGAWLVCAGLLGSVSVAHAELPSFLRMQNSDVQAGNDALQKGDAKSALAAYDKAARVLPDAPGVQLDRGLALLKQGEYGKAREALLAATAPSAASDVRAAAYQDLALSFYREADGLAGQDKHAEAQKMFREAVDASKRSLHLRPDDPNVAWNLELAARRVREEDQKQKDQEQQEKDKQKQEEQDKKDGEQKQDQQNQDQNKDPQDQNKDQQDQQKPSDQDQPDKKPDQQPDKPKDEPQKQPEPKPDDKAQEPNQDPNQQQPPEKALPQEAQQALDSLKDGEENFERYRARQRASRERRAPEKDW